MQRRSRTIIGSMLFTMLSLTAAGAKDTDVKQPERVAVSKQLAEDNLAFALDLFRHVGREEGNVAVSPFGAWTALAMTYGGARGETAQQMRDALRFTLNDEALHPAFATLAESLEDATGEGLELAIANRLWGQEGEPFLDAFLKLVHDNYGGGFESVDYAHAAEDARLAINRWIEKKTRDRIKDLLLKGDVDGATVLVLTNAIYFKGDWHVQFDPEQTREAPFHLAPGEDTPVQMMSLTATFPLFETDQLQAVELPYAGERLSMVVLVPSDEAMLKKLQDEMTAQQFNDLLGNLRPQRLIMQLPRFRVEQRFDLARVLGEMGMPIAFTGGADFSGINGKPHDLFISNVFHKTFVEVSEQGTEAAAGTAVVMKRGRPTMVRADRPFMYLIRDRETGAILFIGRVTDPTA